MTGLNLRVCGEASVTQLGNALALADEIADSATGYVIEGALDEARPGLLRPARQQP